MKLTFLGTGAGEGYPGLWCNCPHCAYARSQGGRNVRGNSCAVLDDTVLIDMGPGCFEAAVRFGVDLTQITSLLITHPHPDHLYPRHLHWRRTQEEAVGLPFTEMTTFPAPRYTPIPELSIHGCAAVTEILDLNSPEFSDCHMSFHQEAESISFVTSGYRVTPITAKHGPCVGYTFSYVIEKDGKCLLYALDCSGYPQNMLDLLKTFRFDLVVMEGTCGLNDAYNKDHMCLERNREMKRFFEENGCMKPGSRFLLSHMSPHWCPPHDLYVPIAAEYGIELAYDGLTVEL